MPKKTQVLPPPPTGEILEQSMESVIHGSMMPYAEYVILDRALPRVEDGLKPVQRRILYTMYELGNSPDKPHRKCARIVGDALGKYHPHGDTSVYDALVRMAQGFVMRAPLVDGHGNFGSIDGDSAAAMRYTEARMTPLAMELLRDIEKDTVEYQLNFDDTLKEPVLLPGKFPNLLVNGASGIAVGLATNIPPHNLGEVIDVTISRIDNPGLTLKEAMELLPGPDFPTGAYIVSSGELERAYETGRGKLTVRAKTTIESAANGKRNIVITELPYQVNKAALLERILKLSEEKKAILSGINDIRDESDRTGIRAVIEVKKDADAEKILQYIFKYTPLQTTFGANMVAIVDGKPLQLGLLSIIDHYIAHQRNVLTRRTRFELEAAKAREHILAGLMIAVEDIDRVIALIKASKNTREARERLMETYKLTEVQAQAILDMRLARLTNLEVIELKKEWEAMRRTIAKLEGILASEAKLLRIIKDELLEIKEKYASPRLTQFISGEDEIEIKASDFIVVEDIFLTLSNGGYIKRYSSRPNLALKEDAELKEGDLVSAFIETKTDAKLLVLTSAGNAYRIDAAAVQESKPRDRGMAITTLCGGLGENENVITILGEAPKDGTIIFCMASGLVKAISVEDLIIKKSKYQACGLAEGDRIVAAMQFQEGCSLMLLTKLGMSLHFSADSIPTTGRTAKGVKGITLDRGDEVVAAFQVIEGEGELICVTDRGYVKRTLLIEYEMQNRNGKGLKCFQFKANASNGSHAVFYEYVREPVDFVLFQTKSAPTRISSEALPIDSRNSKGRPAVMAIMDDVVTGGMKLL